MPKIVMTEAEEFTVLPENTIITIRVDETEVKTVPGKNGEWEKLEVKFHILQAPPQFKDAEDSPIWGSVPFRLTEHPDNKLRQWVEALLGVELGVGFELDTDMLVGRQAKAIVSNWERRNGGVGHQVDALIPISAPVPSQATPAAAPSQANIAAAAAAAVGGSPTPAPAQQQQAPAPAVGTAELPF